MGYGIVEPLEPLEFFGCFFIPVFFIQVFFKIITGGFIIRAVSSYFTKPLENFMKITGNLPRKNTGNIKLSKQNHRNKKIEIKLK